MYRANDVHDQRRSNQVFQVYSLMIVNKRHRVTWSEFHYGVVEDLSQIIIRPGFTRLEKVVV